MLGEHAADRLDPEPVPVIVDERDHHGSRGSSRPVTITIDDSLDLPPLRNPEDKVDTPYLLTAALTVG